MLLAELEREPGPIPVLRRRAASWCERNDLAEEALEYSIAAGDVDTAARLLEQQLWHPAYKQARITTLQRWTWWLDDQGGIEDRPVVAAQAATLTMATGRPADGERWADAVERWRDQNPARPHDPYAEGWAALIRAYRCPGGVEQMRGDADDAVRHWAAANFVGPGAAALQGVARVLCGALDGGDAFLQDTVSIFLQDAARKAGGPDVLAYALSELSLVAIARNQWSREALAIEAAAVLRRAGTEECHATPLVCAVRARIAMHRRDAPAARRELVNAQRSRHLVNYANPPLAVQARIEMTRAYVALSDAPGARTLMREIDELLTRRPHLGTLVGEAQALRTQLSLDRGPVVARASALTAAELRLLPMLGTHLSFPQIAKEMFLSRHTIKTQGVSIYRKLDATSRCQAVARAREIGLLDR
jgi:LuxR family maltose regulon positive regulatory protein